MKISRSAGLALFALTLAATRYAAAQQQPIPEIGPTGPVVELHKGLQFTEGPADDGQGNIYFTDIPADRIYVHTNDGKLETFLDGAGHCNGLMFDAKGTLFACAMDGKLISIDTKTKKITTLADMYEKVRFNAPNDLVIDKQGGIYFTDPLFRAPTPLPQKVMGVYYRSAAGDVTRVGVVSKAPNGVILSPDEKTLYVIPSMQAEMISYPVLGPGKVGDEEIFCTLKQPEGKENTGGDGLAIDTKGNLYITSAIGVQVWSPEGKYLGNIEFPQQPANCDFGGKDRKTLYVTGRTGFYSVPMDARGHAFSGKEL